MNRLLKVSMMVGILVLAIGLLIGAPMVRAGDDSRSERSDLDLSRDDRGELWDDDSHSILKDYHRDRETDQSRELNREHESDRDTYRDNPQERGIERNREDRRERDEIREQLLDHDRDRERTLDKELRGD